MNQSLALASKIAWLLLPYGLAAWLAWEWMARLGDHRPSAGPSPTDDPNAEPTGDDFGDGFDPLALFHGAAAWLLLTSIIALAIGWSIKLFTTLANQILSLRTIFETVVVAAGWGGVAGGNGLTLEYTQRSLVAELGTTALHVLPILLALVWFRAIDHERIQARFPARLRHAPAILIVLVMAVGLIGLIEQLIGLGISLFKLLAFYLDGSPHAESDLSVAILRLSLLLDSTLRLMVVVPAFVLSAGLLRGTIADTLWPHRDNRGKWLWPSLVLALAGYLANGLDLPLMPVRVAAGWLQVGFADSLLEGGLQFAYPILSLSLGALLALWVMAPTRLLIEQLGWRQELSTWERAALLLALAAFMSWPASLLSAIFEASRTDPSDEVLALLPYVLGAAAIALVVWMLFVFKPVVADEDTIG